MIQKSKDGSVTVFLSCIILSLIVFTCTIIDSTRIHVAKIQAERAIRSATNSTMAMYDSQLSLEYGLFAKSNSNLEEDIEYYSKAALRPQDHLDIPNDINQLLHPYEENYWQLYDYEVDVVDITPVGKIVQPHEVELQILEFMKYRAPVLLVEPFLEKMNYIKKSTKTAEYVNKQSEVIKEASSLEDQYRKLQQYIDGLDITKQGDIQYEDTFVKGLIINPKEYDYFKNIPSDIVKNSLYSKSRNFDQIFNDLNTSISEIDNNSINMVQSYRALSKIKEEIAELHDQYKKVRTGITDIKKKLLNIDDSSLRKELLELENEKLNVSQKIASKKSKEKDLEEAFDLYVDIIKEEMNHIEARYNEVSSIYRYNGYLDKNKKSLNITNQIERESKVIKDKLDHFEQEITKEKEHIIDTTYNAMTEELQEIKNKFFMSTVSKESLINMVSVKTVIQSNINTINESKPYYNAMKDIETLLYYTIGKNFDLVQKKEKVILRNCISEINRKGLYLTTNTNKYKGNHNVTKDLIASINNLKKQLLDYNSNIILHYQEINSPSLDPRRNIRTIVDNISSIGTKYLNSTKMITNTTNLPSRTNNIEENVYENNPDFTNESENYHTRAFDLLNDLSSNMSDNLGSIRNELFVNEYILGMFKSATDNLEERDLPTLTLHSKKKHLLDYEVEYILGGSISDKANLLYIKSLVLGIRFIMNYLRIVSSPEKRNLVMSVATSIAGWWTLGIGGYIIAILIMSAWSFAESYFDVKHLVKGEEVPFFKTDEDWYTSLDGAIDQVNDHLNEDDPNDEIIEHPNDDKEKDLPSFSYNDYLRFFLLVAVDNNVKLYRLLDLLQLNIQKTRNNYSFHLSDYMTSYKVTADVSVNYIFFKLPFMPDRVQEVGKRRFELDVITSTSY